MMRPAVPLAATSLQVDAELPGARGARAGEAIGRSPRRRRPARARLRCGARAGGADGAAARRRGGGRRRLRPRRRGGARRRRRCRRAARASTSMRISSAPTASICPTSPPSASTWPATGDGISTVALSVITSASTWSSATVSPGLHVPGHEFDLGDAFADVGHLDDVRAPCHGLHHALQRRGDARRAGEVGPLLRVRIGRVPAGHALDRRLEVVEAVLLHQRRQLGAEAAGARGLVHDDAAAGLLHRGDDASQVQRPQAAQVDDLGVDAGSPRAAASQTKTIVP